MHYIRPTEFKEHRTDGWPLCPRCEEDELWSLLQWNGEGERPPLQAYIDAGLTCYLCQWTNIVQFPASKAELERLKIAALRFEQLTATQEEAWKQGENLTDWLPRE